MTLFGRPPTIPARTWRWRTGRRSTRARLSQLAACAARACVARGRAPADRPKQRVRRIGLFDEVGGAQPHRRDHHGDVGMAGDHDHRRRIVAPVQRAQNVETAHAGHPHVEQHARHLRGQRRGQEVGAVGEGQHPIAFALQKPGGRAPGGLSRRRSPRPAARPARRGPARRRRDRGRAARPRPGQCPSDHRCPPCAAQSAAGSDRLKRAPPPAGLSAHNRPPCASTIVLQIGMPSPIPALLGGEQRLEQPRQHLVGEAGAGIADRDHHFAALPSRARSRPGGRSRPPSASQAFWRMLESTCSIWTRSAITKRASARDRLDDARPPPVRAGEADGDRPRPSSRKALAAAG